MSQQLVFKHDCVILDACSIINLYATDCMLEILQAASVRFAICSYVKEKEALHIWDGNDQNRKVGKVAIDLNPMIVAGILEVVQSDLALLANQILLFAESKIQNGEAISGALASHNNWAIGVDDGNARKKFAELVPQLQLITSFELLRYWVIVKQIPEADVRLILEKIRLKANFIIGKSDPVYQWAITFM